MIRRGRLLFWRGIPLLVTVVTALVTVVTVAEMRDALSHLKKIVEGNRGSSKLLQHDDYVDCDGQTISNLRSVFIRDGIVMFTPCSLASRGGSALLSSVRELILSKCPGPRNNTGCNNRIVHLDHPSVLNLAINSEILNVITVLHDGAKPFPFQTLNFKYGTGQMMHSDLIHFASWPSYRMTAAWVALEDVQATAGPLEYLLRSHLAPFQNMEALSCATGNLSCYEVKLDDYIRQSPKMRKQKNGVDSARNWKLSNMRPRRGQVVLWHANALHRGGLVLNESETRLSQVTHYFFEGDSFYFQPKFSESEDGKFHTFALREDIKAGSVAEDVIRRHWNYQDADFETHYPSYYTNSLRDVHLNDLGVTFQANR